VEPETKTVSDKPARKNKGGSTLRNAAYNKNPLLTLLAEKGLFHDKAKGNSLKSEFSPDRQIMVSGYGPIFKKSGKQLDELLVNAIEDGYLPEGATEQDLYSLIQRAIGGERIAPTLSEQGLANMESEFAAEMDARFEDYLNAELENANNPDWIDADWANLTPEDLDDTGYNRYNEATQAEIRALVAQAEDMGIDAESIQQDLARNMTTATQQDYENAAIQAIQAAIERSNSSRGQDTGQESTEGLTSPTPDDIRAQQDRAEAAERQRKAKDKADAEADRKQREQADIKRASVAAADTFELGGDAMTNLTGQKDIFSEAQQEEEFADLASRIVGSNLIIKCNI
jgi:hypothetical protein